MISQTSGEKVRMLDAGEEHLYLFEQLTNSGPCFIVELEGSRTESQWREAIKKLQHVHPLMQVSIEHKRNQERPIFKKLDRLIEPTFDHWTNESSIERELEKAFSTNFDHNNGDLFFFRIYQGQNKTVIRGSYSHVPYDGFSGLIMLNDLLNFVSDENYTRTIHPVLPQFSELLGAPTDWKYTSRPVTEMELSHFATNPDAEEYRPQVRYDKVVPNMTHIQAAFAQCTATSQPFTVVHPINLRPDLNLAETPGNVSGGGATIINQVHGVSIFDIAKEVKPQLASMRKPVTDKQSLIGFQAILAQMRTPQEAVQFFLNATAPITLSNYGAQKIVKPGYGDLKVQSVFIGNIVPKTIKVDILNHEGVLHIMTTARKPEDVFEGLLPRVENLLRKELNVQ